MSEHSLVTEDEDSLVGLQVGNWVLKRKLGEGGMAVVYLGVHQFLPKVGAVKVLRREFARNENVIERFRREALAADSLNHPSIIKVEDFGRDPHNDFFMVLEYLVGRDLESFSNEAPFAKSWILGVMRQVCAGLETTHQAGIIHRDLKPSNIFLLAGSTRIPRIKILDFGIAKAEQQFDKKLTRTGSIVGTPAYLAPEQLKPKEYELKNTVDIYAIGVILYQLLTGRLPIERDSFFEYLMATFTEVPREIGVLRPELKGTELEALVARLLEKRPEDRPQSMAEVWHLLEKAASSFDDPLDRASKYPSPGRYRGQPVSYEELKAEPTPQRSQVPNSQGTFAYANNHAASEALPSGQAAIPSSGFKVGDVDEFDTFVEVEPESRGLSGQVWGLFFLAFLVVAGVAGWWITQRPKHSVVTPTPRRVQPRPVPKRKTALAFMEELYDKGEKARKSKKYAVAVAAWKKITKFKGWKKSRFFPSLYAGIGVGLARQKRLYSAQVYYSRYLKSAPKKEKHAQQIRNRVMPTLKKKIAVQMKTSQQMLSSVQRQLKRKRWKRAFKEYAKFEKKSVDSPSMHLSMTELLKIRFPLKTLSLLNKIEKELELSKKEKERLRLQREFVLAMLKRQKAELKKQLEAIQKHLQNRGFRVARRKIKAAVQQYTLLTLASPEFLDLINETLPNDIKEGIWIAEFYKKSRKLHNRRGLLAWMVKDARILTDKEMDERIAELRRLLSVQGLLRRMQKALLRGSIDQAARTHSRLQKRLGKDKTKDEWGYRKKAFQGLSNLDGWRPVYHQLFAIHGQLNKYTKMVKLTGFKVHLAIFQEKLELHQKKFPKLLNEKTIKSWKRTILRMERKIRSVQRNKRKANTLFRRKKWMSAWESFNNYLKAAPKAWDRASVKRKMKLCMCGASGVTWDKCK